MVEAIPRQEREVEMIRKQMKRMRKGSLGRKGARVKAHRLSSCQMLSMNSAVDVRIIETGDTPRQ